jgi:1-deoxy-D-xylulose-5-phosphate reductoisomerase
LPYLGIVDTVAEVVSEHVGTGSAGNVGTVEDVLAAEAWARRRAREITGSEGRASTWTG